MNALRWTAGKVLGIFTVALGLFVAMAIFWASLIGAAVILLVVSVYVAIGWHFAGLFTLEQYPHVPVTGRGPGKGKSATEG